MRPNHLYPPNWDRIRYMIFKRDNYTCQLCGKRTEDLHCHHIKPVALGGKSTPDNLITLCSECHEYIHSGHYYLNDVLKYRLKHPI